jgi:four helix bundle protein
VTTADGEKRTREYDLEERTFQFAARVRRFIKQIPKTVSNYDDSKQLIRASGSVGANYIEANESVGEKDFLFRVKVCRKEAKESCYWPRLLDLTASTDLEEECAALLNEANQLVRIFGAIIRKRSE